MLFGISLSVFSPADVSAAALHNTSMEAEISEQKAGKQQFGTCIGYGCFHNLGVHFRAPDFGPHPYSTFSASFPAF